MQSEIEERKLCEQLNDAITAVLGALAGKFDQEIGRALMSQALASMLEAKTALLGHKRQAAIALDESGSAVHRRQWRRLDTRYTFWASDDRAARLSASDGHHCRCPDCGYGWGIDSLSLVTCRCSVPLGTHQRPAPPASDGLQPGCGNV